MTRMRWLLLRLRCVGSRRRRLLLEAACFLVSARVALRLISVRHLLRFVERRSALLTDGASGAGERAAEVRWAVLAVARHAPIRFVCFPQCLAASVLLHRRGVRSVLHYGIARQDGKLVTHTWLQVEDTIVIGGEVASQFTLISSF